MTKYCYIVPKITILGIGGRPFDRPKAMILREKDILKCMNGGNVFEVLKSGITKKLNLKNYNTSTDETITDFDSLPVVKDQEGNIITDSEGNPKFPAVSPVTDSSNKNDNNSSNDSNAEETPAPMAYTLKNSSSKTTSKSAKSSSK